MRGTGRPRKECRQHRCCSGYCSLARACVRIYNKVRVVSQWPTMAQPSTYSFTPSCCERMAHDGDGKRKLRNGLTCRVISENAAIHFAKVCSQPYLFSLLSSAFLPIKNVPKRLPYTKIVDKNTENVKIFCAFRYLFVTLQHSVE